MKDVPQLHERSNIADIDLPAGERIGPKALKLSTMIGWHKTDAPVRREFIGQGTMSIPTFVTQNGQWPLDGWEFKQWPFSVDEVGFLF